MAPEIESQSDPILEYHYRGHKAPVLCSAFNPNQKQVRLRYSLISRQGPMDGEDKHIWTD